MNEKPYAILVWSPPGQPTVSELEREAASGQRPRKDYVELARRLDAEVIDRHYLESRATRPARLLARRGGLSPAEIVEGFLRRNRYARIVAWSDRVGLPLALLFKLARSRRDLVLISHLVTNPKKAVLLTRLRADTHLGAIIGRTFQMELVERLGVPRTKLHVEPQAVDEQFWRPQAREPENLACAVGWEARDYTTLIEAARGLPLEVELAVGSVGVATVESAGRIPAAARALAPDGLPDNVRFSNPTLLELRDLYARSRFVVVPVKEVEYDAGSTVLAEAMAMGKAVIATRNRALRGVFEDGVHGLFVPPGDVAAMRSAIERLAGDDGEARRMGEAGRALVEERQSLDRCMDRIATIVRELASP